MGWRGRGGKQGIGYRCWQTTGLSVLPLITSPPTISTLTISKEEIQMLENQIETVHQQLNQNKRKAEEPRK